ncbi:MAG: molybdopterin cofactor-binding domain-containing protein [Rhodospirillaceae bacterium]|nr:molybdopterin cofactor-binding domain-containing protein [Rhodospirillaceae bacterium]
MTLASPHTLSRRGAVAALALAGGGLVLGVPLARAQAQKKNFGPGGPAEAFQYWLAIDSGGIVTVGVHLAEMGQGVTTALPQLVAEELNVPWADVRFTFPPNGKVYYNRGYGPFQESTGGSSTIRGQFQMFREIGATAREMLKAAAAQEWKVSVAEVTADQGRVVHAASGRSLGYGALAEAASRMAPPTDVPLKPKEQWTLLGKPLPRLDTSAKVDGSAQFGTDVMLQGMLVGAIRMCPVFTGKLKSVDPAPALAVNGVAQVVTLDNAVVVLGSGYWPAHKGLQALAPEWDLGPRAGYDMAALKADLDAGVNNPTAPILHSKGDVDGALQSAKTKLTFDYDAPYLAHACMEPMNATAFVRAGAIDIWMPGQSHTNVIDGVAAALQVDASIIRVHRTFMGGGFGRRGEADVAVQAALVSKAVGVPVKLIWSREEDIRHDYYRPAAKMRFTVALDEAGLPTAMDIASACPSMALRRFPRSVKDGKDMSHVSGIAESPYAVAALRMRSAIVDNGVPVGYWRAVNHSQNLFFRESVINDLAMRAGADPIAYRRKLLADQPRFLALLDAIEDLSDYKTPLTAKPGVRRARGMALNNSHGSLCAQVAEVSVVADNAFTVDRVSCVIDVGVVVNSGIVAAQMESSILDGLSAALFGEITLAHGAAVEGNFDRVRFLKLAEAPDVHVVVREWPGANPGGVGEPGLPPIAPAVTDALARATGQRLRALPIVKQTAGFSV